MFTIWTMMFIKELEQIKPNIGESHDGYACHEYTEVKLGLVEVPEIGWGFWVEEESGSWSESGRYSCLDPVRHETEIDFKYREDAIAEMAGWVGMCAAYGVTPKYAV